MSLLYDVIESLRTMSTLKATAWATGANILMFVLTVSAGELLVRRFHNNRITPQPPPLSRPEILLTISCVVLNAAVAVAGILLWRQGLISLRPYGAYSPVMVLLDAFVLLMVMDLLMYGFHRLAHLPLLYPLAHRTHHNYNNPRPLSLFVLHPFEVVGFGGLWLVVLMLYTASIEGILLYLSLNQLFGMIGHLGVEPMPGRWLQLPGLRTISTSTFHAGHHLDRGANFGFYTLLWDRLFGTLSKAYEADFSRAALSPAGADGPPIQTRNRVDDRLTR